MEQKLPYEQQLSDQWTDLPLPNEDACWADMKRRLEEDDDRPVIFWWRKGCALWGLLLLVLTSIGWWTYNHFAQESNIVSTNQISKRPDSTDNKKQNTATNTRTVIDSNTEKGTTDTKSQLSEEIPIQTEEVDTNDHSKTNSDVNLTKPSTDFNTRQGSIGDKNTRSFYQSPRKSTIRFSREGRTLRSKGTAKQRKPGQPVNNETEEARNETPADIPITQHENKSTILNDTNIVSTKDTVQKREQNLKFDTSKPKENPLRKDSSQKAIYFFSTGLSLFQQIPLAGERFTPYNSLGRKGSLADYIPAPYIRFSRKDKWFLQVEFRYGAPNYARSFIYDQNQTVDTFNNTVLTQSLNLKKSFYHHLPVSFNYYLRPGLSVGTGFVWNKFTGAVAEQESRLLNRSTGVETVLSKGIIRDSSARGFTKSFFQAHLEIQYQVKRYQLGARYNFGLQPYIKFSVPTIGEQSRRMNSLQVYFRYQLWRSKQREKP